MDREVWENRNDEYVEVEIVEERFLCIEEIAKRVEMSESSIRRYVKLGLITPVKKKKGRCLLTEAALFRIAKIRRLRNDLGINLSGIGLILDLLDRIEDLDRQLSELKLRL